MYLCMLDYLGNDKVDPLLNVVKVCRKISNIRQVRLVDGRSHTDIPDEFFDQSSKMLVDIPDDSCI